MESFRFRVGTSEGEILEREIQALDLQAAKEEIRRQGLHIFDVRKSGFSISSLIPKSRKVISTDRFLHFNQELLALVRAGLPILQSLDIMLERQKDARFKQVLSDIRARIQSGSAISDAFASYGSAFPPIYSSSLRAGERSGDLEGVLRRFLRYQKLIVTLRKKVIGALVYPSVLMVLSVAMIFIMLTYVIPKFSEFYQGFDADLPAMTRITIQLSTFVRTNVWLILGIAAATIFLISRWSRTPTGGLTFDRIKLRLPLAGGVLHRFAIMQFTQSLGTLLGGGTPMVPAIEIASQSVTNKLVSSKLTELAQNVRQGEPLWRSLEATGVTSDLAVEMIKVGESTGALVEMLSNVSEFYDEEIEAQLARMIALIEPVVLVVIACVIAGLLYAFYLPMFNLTRVSQ